MRLQIKYPVILFFLLFLLNGCISSTTISTESATTQALTEAPSITASPSPRANAAMVYDEWRKVSVLFGGITSDGRLQNDTWEYDGAQWYLVKTRSSPPSRFDHAMAFDSQLGKTILFGGTTEKSEFTNDVWTYDGNEWVELEFESGPAPRHSAAMAYDEIGERIVLFGGSSRAQKHHDTWKFDGSRWEELPSLSASPALSSPEMAFDSSRATIVVRSFTNGSTFEFSNNAWQQKLPPSENGSINAPFGAKLVYDNFRHLIIMFGGEDVASRDATVEYDGEKWCRTQPPNEPPQRIDHVMAFDDNRKVSIIFGGLASDGNLLSDTWEYDGVTWIQK